jgi:hypothetical protein
VMVAGTEVNSAGVGTIMVAQLSETGMDWVYTTGANSGAVFSTDSSPSGATAMAVRFVAPADLGDGVLDCDPVLLLVDRDGNQGFARCASLAGDGFPAFDGVAIDDAGDVLASGFPGATFDVGEGLTTIDSTFGASILFKMSGADGATRWVTTFRTTYARSLDTDAANRIYTMGHVPSFSDMTLFAGDRVTGCAFDETYDHHLTVMEADGSRLRSSFFGNDGFGAAHADGRVYFVTGTNDREVVPGIASAGPAVLVAVDPDGSVAFVQDLAADAGGDFQASRAVVDGLGNVYVPGQLRGAITLEGGGSVSTPARYNPVMLQFAP